MTITRGCQEVLIKDQYVHSVTPGLGHLPTRVHGAGAVHRARGQGVLIVIEGLCKGVRGVGDGLGCTQSFYTIPNTKLML